MKFAIAMILAALTIVPALAQSGNNVSARARHRARMAAMSPEERTARMSAVRKSKAEARAERTRSATAKFAAAKAACPDCYRVVVTNGVYVGMTKPQYEAYISEKDKKQVAPVYKPMSERPRFQRSKNRIHNRKGKRRVIR